MQQQAAPALTEQELPVQKQVQKPEYQLWPELLPELPESGSGPEQQVPVQEPEQRVLGQSSGGSEIATVLLIGANCSAGMSMATVLPTEGAVSTPSTATVFPQDGVGISIFGATGGVTDLGATETWLQ